MQSSQADKRAAQKRGGTTLKTWGFLAMAVGIVSSMAASQSDTPALFGIVGTLLLFGGFTIFIIGRFQD